MIYGTQETKEYKYNDDYSCDYSPFSGNSGSSFDNVIEALRERKKNLENGGVNCIPSPFVRFRREYPGTEQGRYIVVTANQKIGKTKIASYIFLYNVLDYCYDNPNKCSVHIIYFSLEESPQLVREKYISYLLFKLDKIRISPEDLRSTDETYPVPDEILDLLETDKYKSRLNFFDNNVEFIIEKTNPTEIFEICEEYARKVGTVVNDMNGEFQSYIPDDPNHYKIMFVDHVSLIDTERSMSTKQSIDKLSSEYIVKYLRNRFGYTSIVVQQQAAEAEGTEAIKAKRLMPSSSTLADSKYTARDADLVLGLFNPNKFGLANFHGYDIARLGSNVRFMQVIENRHGNVGGICPLLFDGVTGYFEELPKPDDTKGLNSLYRKIDDMKKSNRQVNIPKTIRRIMFLLLNKNIN